MVSKIKVIDQFYTETTRDADPEDEWSAEDTSTSHYIEGIEISEKYFDLVVPFEVLPDKIYYLVVGNYSRGDSFHQEEGCIEFIDLYESVEKAKACVSALKEHMEKLDKITGLGERFHCNHCVVA